MSKHKSEDYKITAVKRIFINLYKEIIDVVNITWLFFAKLIIKIISSCVFIIKHLLILC